MKITCILVDDEPLARKGILEYISQVEFLQLEGVYEDARSLYSVLSEKEIDLVLLDIELPGLSGIDFIKSLRTSPAIIFITAYPEYAVMGFELDVVDYLMKPVAFPRFLKAVNKAREFLISGKGAQSQGSNEVSYFFVKENGRYTRIGFDEVLFMEALQNYVAIYTKERKMISYNTMAQFEKQLPENLFMRIHKSYIVALQKIDSIEGNMIGIASYKIPCSRNCKDLLMQKVLENKLLKR